MSICVYKGDRERCQYVCIKGIKRGVNMCTRGIERGVKYVYIKLSACLIIIESSGIQDTAATRGVSWLLLWHWFGRFRYRLIGLFS